MNLVGHREAGKTSLAIRLMGQEFSEDIDNTEGVAIHHIESNFNKTEVKGSTWNETKVNIIQLLKDFSHAVLARTKQVPSADTQAKLSGTPPTSQIIKVNKDTKNARLQGYQENPVNTCPYNEQLESNPVDIQEHQCNSEQKIKQNEEEQVNPTIKTKQKLQTMKSNDIYEPNLEMISEETDQKVTKQIISDLKSTQSIVASPQSEKLRYDLEAHKDTLPEQEHNSDTHMTVTLWDLGGQNEFLTTHHLFLHAESTTLIVMDITKPLHQELDKDTKLGHPNTPAEVLHYWLNSLQTQISDQKVKPNIALVLTHTDLICTGNSSYYIETYIDSILKSIEGKSYGNYITRKNIYTVDSKSGNESDFQKLRNQLIQYFTEQDSWGKKIPVTWLRLKADMIEMAQQKKLKHLTVADVEILGSQYRMNKNQIESFLTIQNSLGDFVYYPEPELKGTVILDPQWLVDKYKALITHQKFLDDRKLSEVTTSNLKEGKVTEKDLEELWKKDEVHFLKSLMVHFNLIVPLNNTIATGYTFLIPSMVPARNVRMYEIEPFKDMLLIYNALQKPQKGEAFESGIFHKLLSECSKIPNWKLSSEDNCLSYTDASFEVKRGVWLTLTLLSHTSLRATIWCTPNVLSTFKTDLLGLCQGTRKLLGRKLMTLQIAQKSEFKMICPFKQDNEEYPCLVRMKEYSNPRLNASKYCYLQKKCELHQSTLPLPSLFMLSAGKCKFRRSNNLKFSKPTFVIRGVCSACLKICRFLLNLIGTGHSDIQSVGIYIMSII